METKKTHIVSSVNGEAEGVTEGTRQRVIEAAREQFFAHGFSKVTMDEIVHQLGMSKKTVYRCFASKDELLDAVMAWHAGQVRAMIARIAASDDEFVPKLYALWNSIGHMLSRLSDQFRDDVRRCRPDIWRRIEEFRRNVILGTFSRMIDEGIARGDVRSDVNRDAMILIYLSAVEGIVCPQVLAQHSFSIDEAFSAIMSVYLDGILTDKARRQLHNTMTAQRKASV